MPVADFMAQSVTVERHGRVFRVRAPTVRAVLTFLVLYAREVEAVQSVGMPEDATSLLPLFADARALGVLRLVSDADEATLADPKAVEALARALLSATDLDRVLSFFRPASGSGSAPAPPTRVDPMSASLVKIGTIFGLPPHTVMDWPITAYIETIEVLNAQAAGQDKPAPWIGQHNAPAGVGVYRG